MRLIDTDNLTYSSALPPCGERVFYISKTDILSAPTIDPIHAAGGCYCRECKQWGEDGRCEPRENGLIREYTKSTDFCSYGEPREAQDAQH